jgi:hypothetical protein
MSFIYLLNEQLRLVRCYSNSWDFHSEERH